MVVLWFENVSSTLLNSIQSNFSTFLYHFARFSPASSGLDFLLKMSVSCMLRLYPSRSLENLSKRMVVLALCCSFHLLQCFSIICLLLLSNCGKVSPFSDSFRFPFSDSILFLFASLFFDDAPTKTYITMRQKMSSICFKHNCFYEDFIFEDIIGSWISWLSLKKWGI